MFKFDNKEDMKMMIDAFVSLNKDKPCTMAFGEVIEGMKQYYEVMGMAVDLINLIFEESELKKHHRAYLHVREKLEATAGDALDRINELLLDRSTPHVYEAECCNCTTEKQAAGTVVIPKDQYDSMVEDLLTMAELIDMVAHMRTKDIRFIHEMAKIVPSYAEFEKSRLSLYREAAKEADAIFDRWQDAVEAVDDDYEPDDDEDYEPDEYFSD